MAQNTSDNIRTAAPKPLDDKWGVFEAFPVGWRPFNNIAEFNSIIPLASRFNSQTFWVKSETNADKADLYTLDKNKNPYKVQADVDLSNYYTKAQIDAFNNSMQLEITSLQEVTTELNEDLIDTIETVQELEENKLDKDDVTTAINITYDDLEADKKTFVSEAIGSVAFNLEMNGIGLLRMGVDYNLITSPVRGFVLTGVTFGVNDLIVLTGTFAAPKENEYSDLVAQIVENANVLEILGEDIDNETLARQNADVLINAELTNLDQSTVSSGVVLGDYNTIGASPNTGTNIAGTETYFNTTKAVGNKYLDTVSLYAQKSGSAKLKVITENQDGTVNLLREVAVNIPNTGLVTLIDGIDFFSLSIPDGAYISLFTPTGAAGARLWYRTGTGVNTYQVVGDLTGSNVSKTTLSSLEILVQYSLKTNNDQSIGLSPVTTGSAAGTDTYIFNEVALKDTYVKDIYVWCLSAGIAKIKVLTENLDGTVNLISDTIVTLTTTGLLRLTSGENFSKIFVPKGAYVTLYTPSVGGRFGYRLGTAVKPVYSVTGEIIGANKSKGIILASNTPYIYIVLGLESVDQKIRGYVNSNSSNTNLSNTDIYDAVLATLSVSGLSVSFGGSRLTGSGNTTVLNGSIAVPAATVITSATKTNQTLLYTASANGVGNILSVKNTDGDKVKNISNVTVRRTSDNVLLTLGTDYRVFSPQGKLSGANAGVATVQVNLTFTYAKERIDLLQVSHAGVVTISSGVERFQDAQDDAYIAKPTNGNIPVAYLIVRGTAISVVPCDRWEGKYYRGSEGELQRCIELGKSALVKTQKKLLNGDAIKIGAYGDSLMQTGITANTYTANGINRDHKDYLEEYPLTNVQLYTSVQLGRPDDGAGAVHVKISYYWWLEAYLKSKYTSAISYFNYGIGSTTSENTINNGLWPARIAVPIAEALDFVIIGFGMNELGSLTTYANIVNIINQFKAVGTECIVMGCPRPSSNYRSEFNTWITTNNQLKRAAVDTGSAFIPTLYVADKNRLGYLGMDEEEVCGINSWNHIIPREYRLYGELTTLLF